MVRDNQLYETSTLQLIIFGERQLGCADAAIIVIVKVIKRGLLNALLARSIVHVGSVVVEGIEVLSYTINQRLKARVRLGTGSVTERYHTSVSQRGVFCHIFVGLRLATLT